MFWVYFTLEQNAILVVFVFLFLAWIRHVAFSWRSGCIRPIPILLTRSLSRFHLLLESLFSRGSFRLFSIGLLLDGNSFDWETVIFVFYNPFYRFLAFNLICAGSHISIRKNIISSFLTFLINFISFSFQTFQKDLFSLCYLS